MALYLALVILLSFVATLVLSFRNPVHPGIQLSRKAAKLIKTQRITRQANSLQLCSIASWREIKNENLQYNFYNLITEMQPIIMKRVFAMLFVFCSATAIAQTDSLKSNVYVWNNLKVEKNNGNERRNILEGSTTHLEYLEIHATTLPPGKAPHPPHKHLDTEELIIVKEGTLKVTILDSTKILGPGSIAVAMPGDEHGFVNAGKEPVTYYVIKYRSKAPLNTERATKAGGSYMINWNDVVFKERPKGGSRQFFERPTGMLNRFEMHVTTLNEGLKSHEPHTHVAEEMMFVISGEVEMQIGDAFYKGMAGDLFLVKSGVLHAPRNAGKGPCMYYAIQFH